MGAKNIRNRNDDMQLLTLEDVCSMLKCAPSFIYSRTGPKARNEPRIPTVRNMGALRFHPKVIEELFFQMPQADQKSSLKTKETGKNAASTPKREKVKLW